jgi:hypothetical protein
MKLILAALPLFSFVLWSQPSTPAGHVTVRFGDNPERTFTDKISSRCRAGTTVEYDGVFLRDVLEKVGSPLGKQLKGKALSTYVLATARDGYAVVYTLTEMDTAFTDSEILLADRPKGQPLTEAQGPFRIVVPGDKKPARSLRMLERIDVVPLKK